MFSLSVGHVLFCQSLCHHDPLENSHLLWTCFQSLSKSSSHLRLVLNARLGMFWSSLAHQGIQWFTATFLRTTGTPEYWGQVVQTSPLCSSQAEHLKCLAKETLAFNAPVYSRLIHTTLGGAEMLHPCTLTQPPLISLHFPAIGLPPAQVFTCFHLP